MKTFLMSLLGFGVIGYVLLMVLGSLLGEGGIFVAGLLAAGALFALLACVLEKQQQIEAALNKLIEEKPAEQAEE